MNDESHESLLLTNEILYRYLFGVQSLYLLMTVKQSSVITRITSFRPTMLEMAVQQE